VQAIDLIYQPEIKNILHEDSTNAVKTSDLLKDLDKANLIF